jgi:hypothetical protein
LASLPFEQVRVFAVWEPVLDDDIGVPDDAMAALNDPRAQHFWDKDKLIARALGGAPRFQSGKDVVFDMKDTLWDVALVYPPRMEWDAGKEPVFAGGQIYKFAEDIRGWIRAGGIKPQ